MYIRRNLITAFSIASLIVFSCFALAEPTAPAPDFPAAVERVLPSVVRIIGESTPENIQKHMAASLVSSNNKVYSVGSGFFASSDGKVVTAYHVVAPITGDIVIKHEVGQKIREYKGTVVASDKDADVAIVQIKGKGFPHVVLRDMGKTVRRGENIGFIGYPLLSSYSLVHDGIVSSKVIMPLQEGLKPRLTLVVNAIVNKGNSGGPMFLGKDGTVIGLVNARKGADVEKRKVKLPPNRPQILLGGIDGLALSVEMYNANLELIGEISQFGIGYAISIEYAIRLLDDLEKKEKPGLIKGLFRK